MSISLLVLFFKEISYLVLGISQPLLGLILTLFASKGVKIHESFETNGMDTRLRWEVGTHFKRPTESQKSYMYFSFCYKKYLMYIKFVSNQPQIHIYKRLSILELTHYGFIIYRKDVSVV
jgi:hypothetical protein